MSIDSLESYEESGTIRLPDRITVLQVDDEPEYADLVADFLERLDDRLAVQTVTSAREALDAVNRDGIYCVISDYRMPEMDGVELLREIRETRPDLPFILFTGKGSENVASEAISAGVTNYLTKANHSGQFSHLASEIRRAVERNVANERLQEAHRRFGKLVEHSTDIISVVDVDGKVRYLSPSSEQIWGHAPFDLLGEDAFSFVHPDDRADAERAFEEQLSRPDSTMNMVFRAATRDGSEIWLQSRARNLLDDDDIRGVVVYSRDITEQKELERRLSNYKQAVEGSQDLLAAVDEEERFLFANDSYCEYNDVSAGDVVGKQLDDTLESEVVDAIRPHLADVLNGDIVDFEMTRSHPELGERFLDIIYYPLLSDAGDVQGAVASMRDVTDWKQRERELEESRVQYKTLVDNIPNAGVFLFDEDLRYTIAGGQEFDRHGLTQGGVVGSKMPDVASEEVCEHQRPMYEAALAGATSTWEEDYGGEHYHVTAAPVRDESGEVFAGMLLAQNITEHERRKDELREAMQMFEAVIEASPDPIMFMDVEGRVQIWNPAAERVLGWRNPDVIDESHPYVPDQNVDEFEKNFARLLDGEVIHGIETKRGTKNGDLIDVRLSGAPVYGAADEVIGAMAVLTDVTERKAHERELQRMAEQLEVLNRLIRHDIRNDMQVVTGWIEMLRDHVDHAGRDPLDRIQAASQHVIELTEAARDYVEVVVEDLEPDLHAVSLADTLREEITRRRETYPDAKFRVTSDIPDVDVLATEMLPSVFRNLLNNAVQHNDEPTPVVDISAQTLDSRVLVRVADNGPGIPEERVDDLFTRPDKADRSGKGFGLYLVGRLVEEYGGSIQVKENRPKGAVFEVELRMA